MELSFIAAFIGGLLSLISPCSAMVLPSFVALVSSQKSNMVKVTLIFSLGIVIGVAPLVFGFSFISLLFSHYRQLVTTMLGIIMLLFGVVLLMGYKLPLPDMTSRVANSRWFKGSQSLLLGIIAGLASTTCIGPILGAIMSNAILQGHIWATTLLLISYLLGMVLPLVIIVLGYERFGKSTFMVLRTTTINVGNKKLLVTNVVASILFIGLGYLFVFHQGNISNISFLKILGMGEKAFTLQEQVFEW